MLRLAVASAFDCHCQGSRPSSSSKSRRGNDGDRRQRSGFVSGDGIKRGQGAGNQRNLGFAGLATLLQRRVADQQPQGIAKDKVRKNLGQAEESSPKIDRFKSFNDSFLEKDIKPDEDDGLYVKTIVKETRKEKGDGVLIARDETADKEAISSSSSSPTSSFSKAVLAALQQSALDRQQRKNKRRTMTGGRSRGKEEGKEEQQSRSFPRDVMRPIVVKSEWNEKIQDLEQKLDLLKQQYYKKV